jgi:hypothetical protein
MDSISLWMFLSLAGLERHEVENLVSRKRISIINCKNGKILIPTSEVVLLWEGDLVEISHRGSPIQFTVSQKHLRPIVTSEKNISPQPVTSAIVDIKARLKEQQAIEERSRQKSSLSAVSIKSEPHGRAGKGQRKDGIVLTRISIAIGILIFFTISRNYKSWSEAYDQRQEQARVSEQLDIARGDAEAIAIAERVEQENAKRSAEAEQKRLNAEQEKERRQNVPMGTFAPVKGDRSVAVTEAKLYESIQSGNSFSSPISGQGGLILVVYMTLNNTGKESGDMAWTSFAVEDANGYEYSELEGQSLDLSLWRDEMGLGDADDQLFPGQSKQIAKIFRVKRDASGMKLTAGNYKFLLY